MAATTRSRPRPTALAACMAVGVLAVALAAGLAGCGGDDEAATTTTEDATTTTTEAADPVAERIGQKVANSDDIEDVTSEMQVCVGERFLEDYDEDQALAVAEKADSDTEALTEDETAVLVDALDRCIDGEAYASSFLASLYQGAGLDGGPDDDTVACLSEAVDGQVGTLAAATQSTGQLPDDFSATLDDCIPPDVVGAIVEAGLSEPSEDGTTLTQDQIDCVVDQVSSEVTFSQLAERDPAASDAIRTALQNCPAG